MCAPQGWGTFGANKSGGRQNIPSKCDFLHLPHGIRCPAKLGKELGFSLYFTVNDSVCIFLYQKTKCASCWSCLTLWTPWTVAHQAPLSMGFSRQEYWSGRPDGKVSPGMLAPGTQASSPSRNTHIPIQPPRYAGPFSPPDIHKLILNHLTIYRLEGQS